MPQTLSSDGLAGLLRPGMTVFVQGASGEPTDLVRSLLTLPEASNGVHYVSCQIPGLNHTDFASLHPNARSTGLFLTPDVMASYTAGKIRFMPLAYSGMYDYLSAIDVDVALIQVSAGKKKETFTLGSSVHFVPAILERSKIVIAELNESLPKPGQSFDVCEERLDYIAPADYQLASLEIGKPSAVACEIGAHVAGLIRDGDSLQVGIGKLPSAILHALGSHRRLSCHGGLVSDGMIDLQEAGALDPRKPLICTSVIGTQRIYDWVDGRANVHVLPVATTHSVLEIAKIDQFVAINSVLAVDLSGQANAETVNGRQVGGSGGLSDFTRGARLSREGRSILALPSTAREGAVSRIVPELSLDVASCPRVDADFVVTEHGVASLRYKSIDERALALIAIADPAFRDELEKAWDHRRSQGIS